MSEVDFVPPVDEPEAAAATVPAVERSAEQFRADLARVAGHLNRLRGVTGLRGQLAILRRMKVDGCDGPPELFWNLMAQQGIPEKEEWIWLQLLPHMAARRHDGSTSPGLAFARARLSAQRLQRWLRADRETAWSELFRLLARVGDAGVDWVRLGVLLRYWTPDLRQSVARDFFRSAEYRNRNVSAQGA